MNSTTLRPFPCKTNCWKSLLVTVRIRSAGACPLEKGSRPAVVSVIIIGMTCTRSPNSLMVRIKTQLRLDCRRCFVARLPTGCRPAPEWELVPGLRTFLQRQQTQLVAPAVLPPVLRWGLRKPVLVSQSSDGMPSLDRFRSIPPSAHPNFAQPSRAFLSCPTLARFVQM